MASTPKGRGRVLLLMKPCRGHRQKSCVCGICCRCYSPLKIRVHCGRCFSIVQGFQKDYLLFTFQRFDANVPPACSISVRAHMPICSKNLTADACPLYTICKYMKTAPAPPIASLACALILAGLLAVGCGPPSRFGCICRRLLSPRDHDHA
jgi:hypothetical protein